MTVIIIIAVVIFLWWSLVPAKSREPNLTDIINNAQRDNGNYSNVYSTDFLRGNYYYSDKFPKESKDILVFTGTKFECENYVYHYNSDSKLTKDKLIVETKEIENIELNLPPIPKKKDFYDIEKTNPYNYSISAKNIDEIKHYIDAGETRNISSIILNECFITEELNNIINENYWRDNMMLELNDCVLEDINWSNLGMSSKSWKFNSITVKNINEIKQLTSIIITRDIKSITLKRCLITEELIDIINNNSWNPDIFGISLENCDLINFNLLMKLNKVVSFSFNKYSAKIDDNFIDLLKINRVRSLNISYKNNTEEETKAYNLEMLQNLKNIQVTNIKAAIYINKN